MATFPNSPTHRCNKCERETFKDGIKFYWGHGRAADKRKAFTLISQAMEKGLPKDGEYFSDDYSELNAARFLIPMLLRDDDRVFSGAKEPFWFEKTAEPSEDDEFNISERLRQIFLHITGRGGFPRDLEKAENIAQSIVLDLSFGDREHEPALTLRGILQQAREEEIENSIIKLEDW